MGYLVHLLHTATYSPILVHYPNLKDIIKDSVFPKYRTNSHELPKRAAEILMCVYYAAHIHGTTKVLDYKVSHFGHDNSLVPVA